MKIQTKKRELVKLILDPDNPGILSSVKRIFSNSKNSDFWNTLSQHQKDEILSGLDEIDAGQTIDYEEIVKKQK